METVLLMGHGTRDAEGAAQFVGLLDAVRAAAPDRRVEAGFLEFGGPVLPFIHDAVDQRVAAGVERILAVPVLLHDAGHNTQDMPKQVALARARHPSLDLRMSEALWVCDPLLEVVEDRIRAAQHRLDEIEAERTMILLVGRGTTDPGANSDFFKIGRLLWERNRFGSVECAFVSLTEPTVPSGIERCARLGAERLLLIPYFLHTGVLVKRIAQQARAAQATFPEVEIAVGEPMGVHPNLVRLILDRVAALQDGAPTDERGAQDAGRAVRAAAGRD